MPKARPHALPSLAGSTHMGATEQGVGFPTLSHLPPHPTLSPALFSINESD